MNELQSSVAPETARSWKAVYTIVERAGAEKKFWVRIGTAFVNRDQSINVRLDATPTNGQLHIRDAEPHHKESNRRDPFAGLGSIS